jgi:hypothetical protein
MKWSFPFCNSLKMAASEGKERHEEETLLDYSDKGNRES